MAVPSSNAPTSLAGERDATVMQTRHESSSRRRMSLLSFFLARADRTRYQAALVVLGCLLAIGGALLAAPAAPLSARACT